MSLPLTKEQKLAMAKDVTTAYVRNEKAAPTPQEAAAMLEAIYQKLEELSPSDKASRKVGLGV
jgi:hypothetical protein